MIAARTGWPIVAAMWSEHVFKSADGSEAGRRQDVPGHFGVLAPDGRVIDVEGWHRPAEHPRCVDWQQAGEWAHAGGYGYELPESTADVEDLADLLLDTGEPEGMRSDQQLIAERSERDARKMLAHEGWRVSCRLLYLDSGARNWIVVAKTPDGMSYTALREEIDGAHSSLSASTEESAGRRAVVEAVRARLRAQA